SPFRAAGVDRRWPIAVRSTDELYGPHSPRSEVMISVSSRPEVFPAGPLMSGWEAFPAVAASSVTSPKTPSVEGFVARARCLALANSRVATICIVRGLRRLLPAALMRFSISRVLALGGTTVGRTGRPATPPHLPPAPPPDRPPIPPMR